MDAEDKAGSPKLGGQRSKEGREREEGRGRQRMGRWKRSREGEVREEGRGERAAVEGEGEPLQEVMSRSEGERSGATEHDRLGRETESSEEVQGDTGQWGGTGEEVTLTSA